MKNLTLEMQQEIASIMSLFRSMRNEGKDLTNMYFKANVSGDIAGLAGGDPAAKNAKLTKTDIVNGFTMMDNLNNFWENTAVSMADYNATIQLILNGSAVLGTELSVAVENFADRLKIFSQNALNQFNSVRDISRQYTDTELSAAVTAISIETVVFGSEMTANELTDAINMFNKYIDFIQNTAVATSADYGITIQEWIRL